MAKSFSEIVAMNPEYEEWLEQVASAARALVDRIRDPEAPKDLHIDPWFQAEWAELDRVMKT
jgi:hypothetical protein